MKVCLGLLGGMPFLDSVSVGDANDIKSLGNLYMISGSSGVICVKKEEYIGIVFKSYITLYFKSFPPIVLSFNEHSEKGKKLLDIIQKEFIEKFKNETEIDLLNT